MGTTPDPELLLQHDAWMRGLAMALVRDPAVADDLVQETWLAAVRNPRGARGDRTVGSRPWLSTVLHNAAKQWRRASARRNRHEVAASADTEQEAGSAAHSVEQLEWRRELIDAVLVLPEPQRDAITMRYLDGLPPRRIAARLAVPVATVHTRIERGLAKLRAQLDRRHGTRAAWAAPCWAWFGDAPVRALAGGGTTGVGAWIGVGIMSAKTKLVWSLAAGVVASSLLYWLWSDPTPGAVTPDRADATRVASAASARPDVPEAEASEATAKRSVAESPPVDSPAPIASRDRTVLGQVLRVDGTPLPQVGVRVASHHHEVASSPTGDSPPGGALENRPRDHRLAAVRTGADGKFELATEDRSGFLVVDEPGWATVYAGDLRGEAGEIVVIAARDRSLRGVVRGSNGQPIAAVAVTLRVDQSVRARLDRVLDRSHDASWSVRTDEHGHFDFGRVPRLAAAELQVRQLGYVGWQRALAELPADVVIELKRPEAIAGVVRGVVLDPSSRPVAGAWVGAGRAMTRTEADGGFRLSRRRLGQAESITAVAKGWRPTRLERAGVGTGGAGSSAGQANGEWPDYLELRLGARALELRGRVIGDDGKGVAGARVWVVDPTTIGVQGGRPVVLEGVSGGILRADELRRSLEPGLDAAAMRARVDRSPSMVWGFVYTDSAGAFRLTGLADREYRVAAIDPSTLVSTDRNGVRAGLTEVELRLPTDRLVERIRGRVVTAAGQPVPGVTVRASKIVAHVEFGDDASWMRSARAEATSTTDADGRFELRGVPRTGVSIRMDGDGILPDSLSIDEVAAGRSAASTEAEWTGVELRASLRFHVQAVLADRSRGNRVAVLDRDGAMMTLTVFFGAGSRTMDEYVPLHEGKSAAFVVPEGATTLVLFDGKREVERTRLQLTAGQLNRVEL